MNNTKSLIDNTSKAPLDNVMMAMDVVDTLRHRDQVVERELSSDSNDKKLIARLRSIYKAQGIEVSDRVLQEGVAALKEERFSYKPLPPSLKRTIALIYINRGKYTKYLAVACLALVVLVGGYYFGYVWPQQRQQAAITRQLNEELPARVDALVTSIEAISKDEAATTTADRLASQAKTAIANRDQIEANTAIDRLQDLKTSLDLNYKLTIVQQGQSGTWRQPNSGGKRSYYLIVQAIDGKDQKLSLPITNIETGKIATVDTWGVKVSEDVFNQVRSDKQDDGIIQNNIIGVKQRGLLNINYVIPVVGGAITSW